MPTKLSRKSRPEAVIAVFAATARPVILRYFPRNSCIASSRITIECLKIFGVPSHAVPVTLKVEVRAHKIMFVCGIDEETQARARQSAASYIALQRTGWNGHLIVKAGRHVIDPSFDQVLDVFASQGIQIETRPAVFVIPVGDARLVKSFAIDFVALTDDGAKIDGQYFGIEDYSFQQTPAWETDHLEPAIREITSGMKREL